VPLPPRVARFHQITLETAIVVVSVEDGSPAQRAGVHPGDLVVALDGHVIAGVDDLHRLLSDSQPGLRCLLTVIRGPQKLDLEVLPQEAPN
jgi:S1-C subfamily serine protease